MSAKIVTAIIEFDLHRIDLDNGILQELPQMGAHVITPKFYWDESQVTVVDYIVSDKPPEWGFGDFVSREDWPRLPKVSQLVSSTGLLWYSDQDPDSINEHEFPMRMIGNNGKVDW